MDHADISKMLNALSNQKIQFVTSRKDGASLPTQGRQVIVTGPPEAVAIAGSGDPQVLPELINLLQDPRRNWAAEVLLAAMTGHEEDIVNAFANRPEDWQHGLAKDAYKRWNTWLPEHKAGLHWDQQTKRFTDQQP